MQNDVNNETEVSTTGETPVVETNKQEQPAEAQAPVTATEDTGAQAAKAPETAPTAQPSPTERTEGLPGHHATGYRPPPHGHSGVGRQGSPLGAQRGQGERGRRGRAAARLVAPVGG